MSSSQSLASAKGCRAAARRRSLVFLLTLGLGHWDIILGLAIGGVAAAPLGALLVRLADDSGELLLRFLNFYGSQQKSWAPGVRLRVRGELVADKMIAKEVVLVEKLEDLRAPEMPAP